MFLDLEHQVLKILRQNKIENTFVLVALSGGLDSVVLLSLLASLRRVLGLNLKACYVHHGFCEDSNLADYRQEAQQFCLEFCAQLGLEFAALNREPELDRELKSEEEMRDLRHSLLRKELEKEGIAAERWLALAHHGDDLLETRLHRLIRGTGLEGLESMKVKENSLLRPLLGFNREEIHQYGTEKKLKWLEDPSNQDERHFRSWLRKSWLPDLEKRQLGAKKSLARSLELISGNYKNDKKDEMDQMDEMKGLVFLDQGLCRREFDKLSLKDQKRVIVLHLSQLGCRDFSHNQVLEILKQLDIHKKEHTFVVAQCRWELSADRVSIVRL